jgi:hypothetical protein
MRIRLLWLIPAAAMGTLLTAQTNVLTFHNDVARTGQNLSETILTTSNVNSTTFGKLFQLTLDGVVDAQPLYAAGISVPSQGTHNLLIVATENDSLYGLDADSGAQIWKASLLGTGETPSDDRNCSQVAPQIGITSTPVIALQSGSSSSGKSGTPAARMPRVAQVAEGGAIFAVAMSKDSSSNYHQRLHKVSLATGNPLATAVEVTGKYPGTGEDGSGGTVYFDGKQYKERSGLLLLNGVVYLAWASHCDHPPYTGWIMGYSGSTLAQLSVIDVTPNGAEGAIWGSGAGLAADSSGYIYFLDANGTFDTTLNAQGFPTSGDFGNAFIKLSAASNHLTVTDYFTMYNTAAESAGDVDLGSGGALVLPNMTDSTGATRSLAIGAGKDGNIYMVDRNNMGKFNPQNDSAIYQELDGALPGGAWSMPAYYNGEVYFGAVGGPIRAFQFSKALLSTAPVSTTATSFPYPGATPSISANGTNNGILWAVQNNSTAVLYAYTAGNLAQELYDTNQAAGGRDHFGAGNKFMVPTIANGKVYVGTPNGVAAFGLLADGASH